MTWNAGRGIFVVAVLALAARALVLANLIDHPLLRPEGGLDSGVYFDLARKVAGGDLFLRTVAEPFFVSPGYLYFVAVILAATLGALGAVLAVQVVLGAVAVGLVGDTARRLYGERAAVPAALLLALCGVVAFHEAIPLQAAIDPFLTALTLWLLVRALEGASTRDFALAGAALGLFALNRPNVLPWAGLVVALVLAGRGLRTGARAVGAFALGVVLGIAPATLRNLAVSGEPVLVSSHGGLNLLIGNGPGADGTYRWLDGITPSIAGQAADARRVAEREERRQLSSGEVSAHFARKAFAWVKAQPAAASRLFARKVWYVLSGDEAPLNFSYAWYRRQYLALQLLPVGAWLLVPLGGAGLLLGLFGSPTMRRRDVAIWASFVPAYLLLVATFFVATRYRIPLYVPLATAGGGLVAATLGALKDRRAGRLPLAWAVAVPLTALVLWPTGLDDASGEEEAKWVLHLVDAGDPSAGRRAEALSHGYHQPGVLWFRVGQAQAVAGRLDEAIGSLERSLAIDARQKETEKLLAEAHARRGIERTLAGNLDGARRDLEEAVRLAPGDPAALLNLAAVVAEQGELSRARALTREALALEPGYEKAQALLRALDRLK